MKRMKLGLAVAAAVGAAAAWGAVDGMLDVYWNAQDGQSHWAYQQTGRAVEANPTEQYHRQRVFDYATTEGGIAQSAETFEVRPGAKYVFTGLVRATNGLSNSADGEKDLSQIAAKLATGGVYDGMVGVAYADADGRQRWLAKKNFRFTSVWEEFSLVFDLPGDAKGPVAARALLTIFKKDAHFQTTKLRVSEGRVETVDVSRLPLRPYRNTDEAPGWCASGDHDMRDFKGGRLVRADIPFDVPSAGCLAVSARPGFAREIEVPVKPDVDRVYLFNTAAWSARGRTLANLVWNYADGTRVTNAIVGEVSSGDWFTVKMQAPRQALLVEEFGACRLARSVACFVTSPFNPRIGKPLKSVTLAAGAEPEPIWFVLGLSLGWGESVATVTTRASEARPLDRTGWFDIDLRAKRNAGRPLVDLSKFVEAPAGRHGFVQVKDGHFAFADGTPARFFGSELGGTARFPTHEEADAVADTLARYGVNSLRMALPAADQKYIVGDWKRQYFPKDADLLDRFDYFYAKLREKGVYFVVDLHGGMTLQRCRDAGGFVGMETYWPQNRPWHYYDERIQELYFRFAQEDLVRVNKYTGLRYIDDPAIALGICFNESGVFWDYRMRRGCPEYYKDLLRVKFAAFLKARYGRDFGEKVDPHWNWDLVNVGKNPTPRQRDSILFYHELERAFCAMAKERFVKMGFRPPITMTNADLSSGGFDWTAQNTYYDHSKHVPAYDGKGKWLGYHVESSNIPETLVNPMTALTLEPGLVSTKVVGKPAGTTETDIMFPQDWRSMHLFNLITTASLQDRDLMTQFQLLGGSHSRWEQAVKRNLIIGPATECNDPCMYGVFPAMQIAYQRRDVAPGRNSVVFTQDEADKGRYFYGRSYDFPVNYVTWLCRFARSLDDSVPSDTTAVVGAKVPGAEGRLFFPATGAECQDKNDLLVPKLDRALKDAGLLAKDRGLQDGRIVSDTGELVRDWQKGRATMDTPRTQGFTGVVEDGAVELRDIRFEMPKGFATVIATSLDGRPLATAGEVFLTTISRAQNKFDDIVYKNAGRTPGGWEYGLDITVFWGTDGMEGKKDGVVCEPVAGTLVLKGAKRVVVTPLDERMCAAAEPTAFAAGAEGAVAVTLPTPRPSIWHHLKIER
jgi:hypothetical protein